MNREELAYLAGIVDGEGYIGAGKRRNLRVQVAMTDESLISWISEKWGKRSVVQDRGPGFRKLYTVYLTCQDAAKRLRELLPFLRVKRQQAEVGIRLAELRSVNWHTGGIKIDNIEDQDECVALLKKLKGGAVEFVLPEVLPQARPIRHGTRWGYHQGCKCGSCRGANATHSRKRRSSSR